MSFDKHSHKIPGGWTHDDLLRHPSFKGLREDK
jgi:hypothetical protein